MADPEQVILSCFPDSETEVSTTSIVQALEPTLLPPDGFQPEALHEYHQKKAQLHRKTLYYLNKLVEQGVLKVTREGKNREKYFVHPQTTRPEIASRSVPPSMPIEGYEQLGIIHRFESLTWVERLNSVLVEATACKNLKEVMHAILSAFSVVNDVVALNDAEILLEHVDVVGITTFVERLNSKCNDYGKRVCFIIDFTNLTKPDLLFKLAEHVLNEKLRNITFIYDCTPRESQQHATLFQRLLSIYSTAGKDLYIKNQAVHEAPYFIGRIGPYTFDEQDWKTYKKQMQGSIQEIICSQVSVLVDVKRLFSHLPRTEESLRAFLMKIAHTLLMTNSLQRRKCEELFGSLIKLNAEHARNFFLFSRNNIRFWNYGWKNPAIDQAAMVQMFKNTLRTLHEFCIAEETIYKSCGMPTRFRTAFSCCFDDAVKDIFTPPDYTQFTIKKFDDFYQPTIQTWIKTKEELFQVFDGGDIISFYKHGGDPEHLFREISFILTTYRIPFFRFRFTGPREKETTLKAWT